MLEVHGLPQISQYYVVLYVSRRSNERTYTMIATNSVTNRTHSIRQERHIFDSLLETEIHNTIIKFMWLRLAEAIYNEDYDKL